MKKLILIIGIFLSTSVWADDEFPIELTCEVGTNIVYLHLNEEVDESWWKNHPSNKNHNYAPQNRGPYGSTKFKGKENAFKTLNYYENKIEVSYGDIWIGEFLGINRKNGMNSSGGKCYKGFKEYEKQI